jgi:hypothetical protein
MDTGVRRWIGLGGLVFVALVIVAVAFFSSAPGTNANAAKVVSYYTQHKNAQ